MQWISRHLWSLFHIGKKVIMDGFELYKGKFCPFRRILLVKVAYSSMKWIGS